LRALWQSAGERPTTPSVAELQRRARVFERRVRWRNLREYAGVVLLTGVWLAVALAASGTVLVRAACLLLIAAGAAIAVQLARRGGMRSAPPDLTTAAHLAFMKEQLERQRDLLRDVWRWYLTPFVPGLTLFLIAVPLEAPLKDRAGALWIGSALGAGIVALAFYGVARLNAAGARHLQREIDLLDRALQDGNQR
jgi:hypothetical protein